MPTPTPKALCHKARGCADPGATPGPGRIEFPTPQGVVPFMPTGWVEQTQAEWNQIRGCGRRVHQEGMSTLHTMSKHHMPPVRSFGTTLSGLFLYPQSTHGSTSAVQPWALWQNPVGIPGSAIGPPSPQPSPYPVAFPEGTSPSDGVSSNLLSPDPAGLNSDASRQIGQRLHTGASPNPRPPFPPTHAHRREVIAQRG